MKPAVRVLKKDFVQNVDYQVLRRNAEQTKKGRGGHNKIDYLLAVPCLEYFVAKRVKPVFEVYRKVFHKAINQGPQLSERASAYQEETVIHKSNNGGKKNSMG